MKTYIARVQTPVGTQTIKLNADSIEEAAAVLQSRVHTPANGSVKYIIQEQSPLDQPHMYGGLMSATAALIACLLALAFADHQLRKWLKG